MATKALSGRRKPPRIRPAVIGRILWSVPFSYVAIALAVGSMLWSTLDLTAHSMHAG